MAVVKTLIRLTAAVTAATIVGGVALPSMVVSVVNAHLRRAAAAAAEWDIPAPMDQVFREAAQATGVPWVLLAGVASVATDFGRHGPDGVARGATPGTSIHPVLVPALSGPSGGSGIFLIDPAATNPPGDPQDVSASAGSLAAVLAASAASPIPPLAAASFWIRKIASLPLRITAVAAHGGHLLGDGSNPIRQFGALVLARLGAPVVPANLDAIAAWAAGEGSCAAFNPLATTRPEPGATPFNNVSGGGHVWNYPSLDTGVDATVQTLLNGRYQTIISALQAGAGVAALAAAVQSSPWGTGAFGSPSFAGSLCGPSNVTTAPTGPDAVATTIVARAARYQALWDHNGAVGGPDGHGLPVDVAWYRTNPGWFQRPHHDYPAVDIPVPAGTPVLAVVAGRVAAVDQGGGSTDCGHDVRLEGRDGAIYSYCHGSQVLVSAGQEVRLGQILMYSGWSGSVVPPGPGGAHLHFQIDFPGRPGSLCPQPALAAWAEGRPSDPDRLPASGCVAGHL